MWACSITSLCLTTAASGNTLSTNDVLLKIDLPRADSKIRRMNMNNDIDLRPLG